MHARSQMTLPEGARLLHIGMPKTGTTALQAALHAARPELEALGAHNVGRGRHEMRTALTAAGTLPDYWGNRWDERWLQLAAEFRDSRARCTFWSSESLSQAPPARIRHIADSLGEDSHVVVTLRPLAPMLASQWQEVLRRRGVEPLETWLRRHFDAVTLEGEVRQPWQRVMPILHRFSLRRIIDEWGAVFGQERLVFVVVDPTDRRMHLRVFEDLLGVPEGTLVLQDLDNASLPYPEAEMLRNFNLAYTERGGDHPTWMFTAGQEGKAGLRRLTGLTRYPIAVPRWAAERSNAYTEAWIEEVRRSDVTVIGDLAHLLVDVEDYAADPTPPTTVSVESAGRIADALFASALGYVPEDRSQPGLEAYGGRELLREAARRARRRLRRR